MRRLVEWLPTMVEGILIGIESFFTVIFLIAALIPLNALLRDNGRGTGWLWGAGITLMCVIVINTFIKVYRIQARDRRVR